MLITAKQVDDAVAAGQPSVQVPAGAIVTPAARDRARELGVSIGASLNPGFAKGNGASAPAAPAPPPAATGAGVGAPQQAPVRPPASVRPGAQHEIDIKPNYFESPAIDNLFTIALELGAAIWVVKDRLRVIEEFLDKQGYVTTEMVEMYQPTPEQKRELTEQRNAFIERIYGIIKDNPG